MAEKNKKQKSDPSQGLEAAQSRLASVARNEPCPCGSGKKYKKCHLIEDEALTAPPLVEPQAEDHVQNGWRLFEQRRPGAAEKEFQAALAQKVGLTDAIVGIGMTRLQAGDNDSAKLRFEEVIKVSEDKGLPEDLRAKDVKDAFTRPDAQAYVRACHALGCLAFDAEKWDEAVSGLERVYAVDEGSVGTEARLVAAKALMKLGRPTDAAAVLEPAKDGKSGAGRAHMGLALASLNNGDQAAAARFLADALAANAYLGKAVLGQIKGRVENPALAAPGSRDEAILYAQTYGDVWDEAAKKFLADHMTGAPLTPAAAQEAGAGAP